MLVNLSRPASKAPAPKQIRRAQYPELSSLETNIIRPPYIVGRLEFGNGAHEKPQIEHREQLNPGVSVHSIRTESDDGVNGNRPAGREKTRRTRDDQQDH